MRSPVLKIAAARTVALTAAACAVSLLAFAGTSLAAAPPTGAACQAADGKISGRGATFQTRAMTAFIAGYTSDVCGPVATDAASGTNMLVYNQTGKPNGSGQGQVATSCRLDAFGGTDIPYDQGGGTDIAFGNGTLDKLDSTPGALDTAGACQTSPYAPPYQPNTPATWPDPADQAATVMSFPVAGSSDAIAIRLDAGAGCPNRTSATTAINLTTAALSGLAGGDILTWGDSRLTANNASLVGCTVPVRRVVRFDKSGTTQIFKNYLSNADPNRTGATCDPGNSWNSLAQDANNVSWPGAPGNAGPPPTSQGVAATATCSALANGGSNGNPAMITATRATNGSFSYPDLADAVVAGTPPLVLAGVRNATNTSFQGPSAGNPANCDLAVNTPGSGSSGAVGLDRSRDPAAGIFTNDTWAFNNDAPWPSGANPNVNRSDVTFKGSKYPICGLTFDFVYTGLNNGAAPNAIARLAANQRRTLYSFVTYMFSPAAQSRLAAARYAPLPATVLPTLRAGFQAGF
jgi:ABC-type phosphate transport system substrate-binding protein